MKERSKLTPGELNNVLSWFQSIFTIVIFFAGFVFVTIPLVIFSAEISSLYGRLGLYCLLTSLFVFTIILDLYVVQVIRVWAETSPNTMRILRKYREAGIADQFMTIAIFFASASISFMLLLKGQELMVEAVMWFLLSVIRIIFSHLIVHGYIKLPFRKTRMSTNT